MENRPPDLPLDELRSGSPRSGETIDALHTELGKAQPSAEAITEHVETLRRQPPLVAILENWFEDPRTQAFLAELSATGL
jgi:hypothetical protein